MMKVSEFGLSPETVAKIRAVFASHPNVDEVILYGSRARGDFRPNSDIDMTLIGPNLSLRDLSSIEEQMDDLLLAFGVDLSIFENIADKDLRAKITSEGRLLYRRQ